MKDVNDIKGNSTSSKNIFENKMKFGTTSIASTDKFLEGMRYQGLKDEDAIKEFVDNSFDAEANNIHINTWEENGSICISIQDDGMGMTPIELESSIAFGASGGIANSMNRIGRFGFGMPTAILGKTKYAEVYSSRGDFSYYYTRLNLDEILENDNLCLPQPVKKDPIDQYKMFKKLEMGTIVILKNCDRLDFKGHDTIANHLKKDLAETYRHFLVDGRNIFVNGVKLKLIDPLMLMKGHQYRDMIVSNLQNLGKIDKKNLGYSKEYQTLPIPINYTDDSGVKKTSNISLKMVLLPQEDMWKSKSNSSSAAAKAYDISMKRQGFYLMRNGRQIAEGQNLGIYTRHNSMNYFRCEIYFDSVLDNEFGIQINKSRFSLSRSAQTKIKNEISKHLRQVKADADKARKKIEKKTDTDKNPSTIGVAEKIIQKNLTIAIKKVRKATEEETKERIEEEIESIKKDARIDQDEKNIKIKNLRKAVEEKLQYTFDAEYHKQGPMFWWELDGRLTRIFINMEHPFYAYYWEQYSDNEYMKTLLKLLIYSLVHAEQRYDDEYNDGNRMTFDEVHNLYSAILKKTLKSAEFVEFAELKRKQKD